jgi:hypothetical protein
MSGGAAALVARAYISDDRLYSQLITRSFPSSVQIAHAGSSLPACSATMYAAYQSAHSASRLPGAFLVLAVGSLRAPHRGRQVARGPVRRDARSQLLPFADAALLCLRLIVAAIFFDSGRRHACWTIVSSKRKAMSHCSTYLMKQRKQES